MCSFLGKKDLKGSTEAKLPRQRLSQQQPPGSCSHGCSMPTEAGACSLNVAVLHVICQCCGIKMPPVSAYSLLMCLPALPASQEECADTVVWFLRAGVLFLRDTTTGELPGHLPRVLTEMQTIRVCSPSQIAEQL